MRALREGVADGDPEVPKQASDRPDAALVERAARSELLGELASALAHEARNPLNAMAIHLEVLADKLRGDGDAVPPALEKNLSAAKHQIRRIDGLLRGFAEFATGRGSIEEGELETVLRRAAALCEYHARRAGVGVTLELEGPGAVEDGASVAQAAVAYLLAGVAAAGPGGRLRIVSRRAGRWAEIEWISEGQGAAAPDRAAGRASLDAADAIVARHGGELEWTEAAGTVRRTVRLPIRGPA